MPASPTARMGLKAIAGSDAASTIDTTTQDMAKAVDDVAAIFSQGTFATRPTSTPGSPGIQGRFYYATDQGILYYDFGTGWKEVRIGDVSLSDDDFAASAGMYSMLKQVVSAKGHVYDGLAAGVYSLTTAGPAVASGQAISHSVGVGVSPPALTFSGSDFSVSGRSTKFRVRATVLVNGAAPGVNLTFGLYPVASALGGAGQLGVTLGTVLSGSTVAVNAPSAGSRTGVSSGDFDVSSNDTYALGVALSGTIAASSVVVMTAQLLYRHV